MNLVLILVGFVGVIWLGLSVWEAVLDIKKWRRKRTAALCERDKQ